MPATMTQETLNLDFVEQNGQDHREREKEQQLHIGYDQRVLQRQEEFAVAKQQLKVGPSHPWTG